MKLLVLILFLCCLSVPAQAAYDLTCAGTDDTSELQAVINGGAKIIRFPPVTCQIGAAGLVGVSNQVWQGVPGQTVIQLTANPVGEMIVFVGKSNFHIRGITFDYANKTPPSSNSTLAVAVSSNFTVEDCRFINQAIFGLGLNAVSRVRLRKLYIEKAAVSNAHNQGIVISTYSGNSTDILLEDIYMKNTAIDISGSFVTLDRVTVQDFGFGAGATFELDTYTRDIKISNSHFSGGVGTDVNGTRPQGVESWAPRTIITNTTASENSGAGFEIGGMRSVVTSCTVWNNGKTSPNGSGIALRYVDANNNASYSVITGNAGYDTAGSGGTQAYGLVFQSASIVAVNATANSFAGNKTGTINLNGATLATP